MKLYGPLTNYLVMYRKRARLTQDELAALIGCNRSTISRYEGNVRLPDSRILIALEIILDAPAQVLFQGLAEDIGKDICHQAKSLLENLSDEPSRGWKQKVDTYSRLASYDNE